MSVRPTIALPDETFSDREYQIRAVRAIVAGLSGGGRGQVYAACGTGKTSMAMWAAERLTPAGGTVVVLVPTVGLVGQTLREWRIAHPDLDALAVCSDTTVADEGRPTEDATRDGAAVPVGEDALGSVAELIEPVTVDSDVVAGWLWQRHSERGNQRMRLIVGTHISAHVIGEGLQKTRTEAQLLVIDEAHRTAGRRDKRIMLVHDDEVVPARRRLYMTATPRVDVRGDREDALSMDDESIFGPVLFNYPFSQAISDGWLDDYRLAVVGVTKAEVLAVLRRAAAKISPHSALPSEHAAMVQAAIARASVRFNLRRIIAFCPLVADAQAFAETFPRTIAALPVGTCPSRPLHATHINGSMRQAQRRAVLETLAQPPGDGWTVVTNARCLSEGIDVPAVDSVAFTAPKESPTEIVQAIGRALRRDPNGSGMATILVPILLPDTISDKGVRDVATVDFESFDVGSFAVLWEVVNGLRAHDDRFDVSMRPTRAQHYARGAAPDRIEAVLPEGMDEADLVQHLGVYLVKAGNSAWWDGYHRLVRFKEHEGHANPELKYVDSDGAQLGQWLARARTHYRRGQLAQDRAEALIALGVEFDERGDARWWNSFQRLLAFKEREGHANPAHNLIEPDGFKLGMWASHARRLYRKGAFDQRRMEALEGLGVVFEDRTRAKWWHSFDRLAEFAEREGHADPASRHVESDGFKLGEWAGRARMDYSRGKLAPDRVEALAAIGFVFVEKTKTQWEQRWNVAADYYAKHGHLDPPAGTAHQGVDLHVWLRSQRSRHNAGRMDPEQSRKLELIGIQWRPQRPRWAKDLPARVQELRDFVAEHGRLPETYSKDGEPGALVQRLRRARASGGLDDVVVEQLTELGMNWQGAGTEPANRKPVPAVKKWWIGYRHLLAFYEKQGHSRVTHTHVTDDGYELGHWIASTRRTYKRGKLAADRVDALKRIEFWFDVEEETWEHAFGVAAAFHAEHGHLDLVKRQTVNGVALGEWLYSQRNKHANGTLREDRAARLSALGMRWGTGQDERAWRWRHYVPALRAYHAAHGTLPTRNTNPELEDLQQSLRIARRHGALTGDVIEALDQLGMKWDPTPPSGASQ